MLTTISGIVSNGVVVPQSPLPEGAHVEIQLTESRSVLSPGSVSPHTASELRKLPRAERHPVLAAAAALAEDVYRSDKNLTGFEAFREEELDGDDSDPR